MHRDAVALRKDYAEATGDRDAWRRLRGRAAAATRDPDAARLRGTRTGPPGGRPGRELAVEAGRRRRKRAYVETEREAGGGGRGGLLRCQHAIAECRVGSHAIAACHGRVGVQSNDAGRDGEAFGSGGEAGGARAAGLRRP